MKFNLTSKEIVKRLGTLVLGRLRLYTLLVSVLILLKLSSGSLYGQMLESNDLNLDFISHRKVKKYLKAKDLCLLTHFKDVETACIEPSNKAGHHVSEYEFNLPISEVWSKYINKDVRNIWKGNRLVLECLYSPKRDAIVYAIEGTEAVLEVGQVFLTQLTYLNGLLRIPVVHKLTRIDKASKELEFCYVKGGITSGTQKLKFMEVEGKTWLKHETYFHSESKMRSNLLYKAFHQLAINRMHRNVLSREKLQNS